MAEDTITFHGEKYRLADTIALAIMLDSVYLKQRVALGETVSDEEAGMAMREAIEACFDPEDFPKFWAASKRLRTGPEEFQQVINEAMEIMAKRPIQRSSDSSDGPPDTAGSSTEASSSPVVRRLEQRGRGDLALIVEEAEQARAERKPTKRRAARRAS